MVGANFFTSSLSRSGFFLGLPSCGFANSKPEIHHIGKCKFDIQFCVGVYFREGNKRGRLS